MNVLAGIRMQGFSQNGGMAFAPAFQQNEVTVPVLIRPEKITLERQSCHCGRRAPFRKPAAVSNPAPSKVPSNRGGTYAGQLSQPWTLPWVTRGSAQNCVQ